MLCAEEEGRVKVKGRRTRGRQRCRCGEVIERDMNEFFSAFASGFPGLSGLGRCLLTKDGFSIWEPLFRVDALPTLGPQSVKFYCTTAADWGKISDKTSDKHSYVYHMHGTQC